MKIIIFFLILGTSLFADTKKLSDSDVKKFTTEMAKKLPIQVNKYSIMQSFAKLDKDILVTYTTTSNITQELMNKHKEALDNEWCNESFNKEYILKNGYNFVSLMYNKKNKKIGEIITTYEDCLKWSVLDKYKSFLDNLSYDEAKYFNPNSKINKQALKFRLYDVDID